jgi:hypothetical protein
VKSIDTWSRVYARAVGGLLDVGRLSLIASDRRFGECSKVLKVTVLDRRLKVESQLR